MILLLLLFIVLLLSLLLLSPLVTVTPFSYFLLCTSCGGSLARLLGHTEEDLWLGGVEGPALGAGMGLGKEHVKIDG